MREILQTLKQKLKENIERVGEKFLAKYIDFGVFLEEKIIPNYTPMDNEEDEHKEELDLEPLQEYMSDYIGMIVLNIKGFSEDIKIQDTDKIHCKIISDCILVKDSIELHLTYPDGKPSGYLKISPSKHGSFAEREPGSIPIYSSRYRIFFYGGETLEYLDTEKQGSIEYFGE
jgi:hypothetical protein